VRPLSWLRARAPLGRRTVRLRLTALYSALFLISGTVLLAITYLVVDHNKRALFVAVRQRKPGAKTQYFVRAGGKSPPLPPGFRLPHGYSLERLHQLAEKALQAHNSDLHTLLVGSVLGLAGMAVLSVLLGWVVAGRALRPLRTMTATAQQISAHNLHERLAIEGPRDELKQLADTIDGLLGRLEAAFEAQRHFMANASHELRTPLTLQRTLLEVALADPRASLGTLRTACERAVAAGEANEHLIESLLTLATSERGLDAREWLDIAVLAGRVVVEPRLDAEADGVNLELSLQPAPTIGSPQLLERLVANLVDNALRHNIPGGWAKAATRTKPGGAVLSVSNTGPVVPPEEIERLFEPFQRLDGDAGGLGLGLSIVRAVAKAHGAKVTCLARPEGGLDVEVAFPPPPNSGGQTDWATA
jgi:signal transduction histidine kinase